LRKWRTIAAAMTMLLAIVLGGCDLFGSAVPTPAYTPALQSPTPSLAPHTAATITAGDANGGLPPNPTPSPAMAVNLVGGFVKCEGEGRAGSSIYRYLNCWRGSVNGYRMYIWSGYGIDYGGGKGWAPVCGSGYADEYSYYHIGVGDDYRGNDLRGGYGCGYLSIEQVSGTVITFKMENFAGETYTKTLDFAPLLQDGTPTLGR
jgi:hypothetical protein